MRVRPALAAAALAATVVGVAACAQTVSGTGNGRYRASAIAGSPSASRGLPASVPSSAPDSAPQPTGPSSGPSSAPVSSGSGERHPVPAAPLRERTVQGSDGTVYDVKVWAELTGEKDCVAHAYGGPVLSFLQAHPCAAMNRLLATTTVNGRDVGFAERSIAFTGRNAGQAYRIAGKFRKLVSRNGTGNLDDLMREGYRLPSGPKTVPFPNAFSALSQDDGVTIVEAWYLSGSTPDNDPALERMEQAIYLQV